MPFTPEFLTAIGGCFAAVCGGFAVIIGALRGQAEKRVAGREGLCNPGCQDRLARIEADVGAILRAVKS